MNSRSTTFKARTLYARGVSREGQQHAPLVFNATEDTEEATIRRFSHPTEIRRFSIESSHENHPSPWQVLSGFDGTALPLLAQELGYATLQDSDFGARVRETRHQGLAASYHLWRLWCSYEDTIKFHERNASRELTPGRVYATSGDPAFVPSFEIHACLRDLRRLCDVIGKLLFAAVVGQGTMPTNFEKCLKASSGELPAEVIELLSKFWHDTGNRVRDYRDCETHYCLVQREVNRAYVYKIGAELLCTVRLPSNPNVRSYDKFDFDAGPDAFDFLWSALTEISKAMHLVAKIAYVYVEAKNLAV